MSPVRTSHFAASIVALVALTSPADAADALHGKRLYLDAARLVGSGVSCIDCHNALPGGAHAIESAANDPARVARALDSVPQMAPLRGKLTPVDIADLAAYLGDPFVPSPEPQLPGRIDLGTTNDRSTAVVELRNTGALDLALTGAPELTGDPELTLTSTTCAIGPLPSGQACTLTVLATASSTLGLRSARLVIPHDWTYGSSATAVLATVTPSSPAMIDTQSGCTSTPASSSLLVLLLLLGRRRRSPRSTS